MDQIQISKINDFIFCPYSLYFHNIYENFDIATYHDIPQTVGKIKHESIEAGEYSSSKRFIQGLEVASEEYGLLGKIDIYDSEQKMLIERKNKISKIYDGQKYQLYAQYLCMKEMGFKVKKLAIHSLSDNRRYFLDIPTGEELKRFVEVLYKMRNFDLNEPMVKNPAKCANCIYEPLCFL